MTRFQTPSVAICALLFAVSAAGCSPASPTPSPTPLSDPTQIVTLSFARLQASTSLHVQGTISGSVDVSVAGALVGFGSPFLSGKIKLDGATLSGDVDMANQALSLTALFPSLFGSSAQVTVVDGYAYTKVKLPLSVGDDMYKKSKVDAQRLMPSAAPNATFNFSEALKQFDPQIASIAATAVLVGQDTVDGRPAYHLVVTLPAEMVNQAMGAALGSAAGGLSVEVAPADYWVYDDSLTPAGLLLKVSSPTLGNVAVSVTLTKYDQSVVIQAPPDSQVSAG
jgi:hypothetical protein